MWLAKTEKERDLPSTVILINTVLLEKMKLHIALIVLVFLLPVHGDEPPKLPPNLDQVRTGAYWEEGEKRGFVRFCSFERGFEHVRHQIVIEWTLGPTDHDDEISVLSRMVVKEIPDVWSVGEARFVEKGKKQFIEFSATHTYTYKEADFSIEILGVGKIAVAKKDKAEQDGADKPSTIPKVEPSNNDNPNPESKERSQ